MFSQRSVTAKRTGRFAGQSGIPLLLLLLLAGCSDSGPIPIEGERELAVGEQEIKVVGSDAERFRMSAGPRSSASSALEANINRWRAQMGLGPATAAEVAALPTKKLFGRDAVFVSLDGDFKGFGAQEAKPDYRMLGMILSTEQIGSIFVKMTGPRALVEAEAENFDLFCSTIRPADGAGSGQSGIAFDFEKPETWTEAPAAAMRELNFTFGDNGEGECYLTLLPNAGGQR